MRELTMNDTYKMSKILKKVGIKPEVEMKNGEILLDAKFLLEIAFKVAENLHLAQKEANDFFGDLMGKTGEEFGKLPAKDAMAFIKEFKEAEGTADFFKSVSQLIV